MLNDILAFAQEYEMLPRGTRLVCAVSGGADSMALLWAMYLLKDKLGITLSAAHFNHGLRGAESDRDEAFVRDFCRNYSIPLTVGRGTVVPGEKGLEAAAREARYAFFATLPGTIATAHTADDNAETVLLHLVRGTGLKGLGAIAPVNGRLVRPMLRVTRQQVEAFLAEYAIPHIEDSSNGEDAFLRNRLRHRVMPLLKRENPRIAQNLSAMALRLRQDEAALQTMAAYEDLPDIAVLRTLPEAALNRTLESFLRESGVREPESSHIAMARNLVFTDKPSAWATFPGGVIIARNYESLQKRTIRPAPGEAVLPAEGTVELPEWNLRVTVTRAADIVYNQQTYTLSPLGQIRVRSRCSGDEITLSGGTKSLKKLFADRKIPQNQRPLVPVLCDDAGVLGAVGIGMNLERLPAVLPALQLRFEELF